MRAPLSTPRSPLGRRLRQWQHWWQSQDAMRQEYLLMLGPVLSVLLFVAALAASLLYLRSEEANAELEALTRDVNFTHRELRQRVADRLGQINRMAQELEPLRDETEFLFQTALLASQHPELIGISTLNRDGSLRATYVNAQTRASQLRDQEALTQQQAQQALRSLGGQRGVLFAQPYTRAHDAMAATSIVAYGVHAEGGGATLILAVELELEALLRTSLSAELAQRYDIAIVDAQGHTLAGQLTPQRSAWTQQLPGRHTRPEFRTTLAPIAPELWLVARGNRNSPTFAAQALQWATAVISLLTVWMLIANWRHARRRLKTQRAFMVETQFRRAMEDSMLTGMRAMDMQGRITYVNPAFCRMTGWSEAELVGQTPPFSFWPIEDHEQLMQRLQQELEGKINHSGFEVRMRRRTGEIFFTRMYMSPLVAQGGSQSGWMASITDITESKRTREELAAAHERFTTVLGSLDASVSVANVGGSVLLFANDRYRLWFGESVDGHQHMVSHLQIKTVPQADARAHSPNPALLEAQSIDTVLFDETLRMWLEVRSRYLTWVDGSLAQMLIATDVSARHQAQAQAKAHADKAEAASRLITMGEMASSVAHELNQPLTAISNYCSGMISRLKRQQTTPQMLIPALEKTVKQAQRAGQIITRIRAFVKRSEPSVTQARVSDIVNEALELAQLELRRQDVRLQVDIDAQLPLIRVDPILIEQVLINLIKNGADSIAQAKRTHAQRIVSLRVRSQSLEDQQTVIFEVGDTGAGIPEAIRERIYDAFFSTKSEGLGIGLKLCRSIVESHHGRMAVENLYNRSRIVGCCFSFWLPVSNPQARREPGETNPLAPSAKL